MSYYKAGEVLEKAIEIEVKGAAFYQALAETADDSSLIELFTYLAEQEKTHEQTFTAMMDRAGEFREDLGMDYFDYLAGMQLLADQGIFEDDKKTVKQAVLAKSRDDLIRIAMQFEKDSILYYSEMRPVVDADANRILDELIEQERGHLKKLQNLLAG